MGSVVEVEDVVVDTVVSVVDGSEVVSVLTVVVTVDEVDDVEASDVLDEVSVVVVVDSDEEDVEGSAVVDDEAAVVDVVGGLVVVGPVDNFGSRVDVVSGDAGSTTDDVD